MNHVPEKEYAATASLIIKNITNFLPVILVMKQRKHMTDQ